MGKMDRIREWIAASPPPLSTPSDDASVGAPAGEKNHPVHPAHPVKYFHYLLAQILFSTIAGSINGFFQKDFAQNIGSGIPFCCNIFAY
jgi:hypothetical protein